MGDTVMTEVIAERSLSVVTPDGKAGSLTVQVGKPARDSSPGGDWYCPYRIVGLGRDRIRRVFGIDPLQTLQFLLVVLEPEVRRFASDVELSWLGEADLGLKPWLAKEGNDPYQSDGGDKGSACVTPGDLLC